jgi:hypothetical protein
MLRTSGIFAAATVVAGFIALGIADAKPRGTAGTTTRADYCKEQYDSCKKKGEEECLLDQMGWDQSVYNACAAGVENACRRYFIGATSPCNTLPRIAGIRGVYSPAIVASRATRTKLQPPAATQR